MVGGYAKVAMNHVNNEESISFKKGDTVQILAFAPEQNSYLIHKDPAISKGVQVAEAWVPGFIIGMKNKEEQAETQDDSSQGK